jgi:hydrogenase maturation protease
MVSLSHPILVVGLGNAYRSDDVVGLLVARQIREFCLQGVEVIEGVADGTQLIASWAGRKAVFVVDCAISGAEAGYVHRFDGLAQPVPAGLFSVFSTHYFDVTRAVELARALDRLPDRLIIYGIEGSQFRHGTEIAPVVQKAAEEVARMIHQQIDELEHAGS